MTFSSSETRQLQLHSLSYQLTPLQMESGGDRDAKKIEAASDFQLRRAFSTKIQRNVCFSKTLAVA
jgi:hypothetical protein